MNKDQLKSIINKYVGYAEQEIYDAIDEYEEEKINFAKNYCIAALKQASEKAQHSHTCTIWNCEGESINKESILNAYLLENIK